MTTIADVVDGMHAALLGRTDADQRVAIPGDLPTQQNQQPILKLRVLAENKQSTGRGSIGFLTLVTIRLLGEVSEPVDPDDDILVSTVQASLLALKDQAERAVINSYPLFAIVQQLVSVQTQFAFTANAQHLSGIQSDYTFEIFQTADDFAPLEADPITELQAGDPLHPGLGLHLP
ncbi:hypothetical protein ACWGNZ_00690 [Sphingomonas zeae]